MNKSNEITETSMMNIKQGVEDNYKHKSSYLGTSLIDSTETINIIQENSEEGTSRNGLRETEEDLRDREIPDERDAHPMFNH